MFIFYVACLCCLSARVPGYLSGNLLVPATRQPQRGKREGRAAISRNGASLTSPSSVPIPSASR